MVKGAKVYDRVWIMENNRPVKKLVFAVIESMDFYKRGVEVHYQLVDSSLGVGWGNNEGIRREPQDVYISKEEVLASL